MIVHDVKSTKSLLEFPEIAKAFPKRRLYSLKRQEVNKMGKELEAKEVIRLDDGRHEGEIVRIEYREEPYEYTDVIIKETETELEIKYGCPTSVSEASKLGRLLAAISKEDIEPKKKYDPEKILVGKKVSFMTMNEKSDKGEFARIVADSIKEL